MNLRTLYPRFATLASFLQSPLLLVIRLYWGWQFVQTGWGKLTHLQKTADYFGTLGIPMPTLNATVAGATECFGGALLLVGLCSRLVSLPLAFTMFIAYATADKEALQSIFSETDKFTGATPFLFLFAVVIVLAFGPGAFSIDRFLFGKDDRGSVKAA